MATEYAEMSGMQTLSPDSRSSSLCRFSAETLGVALFVFFGHSATAQVLVGDYFKQGHDPSAALNDTTGESAEGGRVFVFDYGDHLTLALAHGIGLTLAISSSGAVSGGHLNPAVTVTEVVLKRLPATAIPIYVMAQCTGAFIGIALVFTIHSGRLVTLLHNGYDISPVYYTSPVLANYDEATLVWDQALASALYAIVYLSMDDENTGVKSKPVRVFYLGTTYTLIKLAVGINSGAAINPAADMIPRIFAYIVGNPDPFENFMFIPLCIPFLGMILGGVIYELCLRFEQLDDVAKVEKRTVMEKILGEIHEMELMLKGDRIVTMQSLHSIGGDFPASRRLIRDF